MPAERALLQSCWAACKGTQQLGGQQLRVHLRMRTAHNGMLLHTLACLLRLLAIVGKEACLEVGEPDALVCRSRQPSLQPSRQNKGQKSLQHINMAHASRRLRELAKR